MDRRELIRRIIAESDHLDRLALRMESRGDGAGEFAKLLRNRVVALRKLAAEVDAAP